MLKLNRMIIVKKLPFVQLVGDQPICAPITPFHNKNIGSSDNIIPVFEGFLIQSVFISSNNKRCAVSGLPDITVLTGTIADISVDQAIRGKHYGRILRALQLR